MAKKTHVVGSRNVFEDLGASTAVGGAGKGRAGQEDWRHHRGSRADSGCRRGDSRTRPTESVGAGAWPPSRVLARPAGTVSGVVGTRCRDCCKAAATDGTPCQSHGGVHQVHPPTLKQTGEFALDGDEFEPRDVARQEFHQHVDVAVGMEVVAKCRTEQRQALDVMSPAKSRECIMVDDEVRAHDAVDHTAIKRLCTACSRADAHTR